MKPTQAVELEWKLVSDYAAQFLEGAYYWCIEKTAIKNKLRPIPCRFMSGSFVYNNADVYAYKFIGPIEVPSLPEPQEKLLTFTGALRVVLDGGIVGHNNKNFDIIEITPFLHYAWSDDGRECGYDIKKWKIIKPAPKPKMPNELREFKEWAFEEKYYCWPTKGHILEKLKPLLELYEDG